MKRKVNKRNKALYGLVFTREIHGIEKYDLMLLCLPTLKYITLSLV